MRTASPQEPAPLIQDGTRPGVRAGDRVFVGLAAGAGIFVLVIMGAIGAFLFIRLRELGGRYRQLKLCMRKLYEKKAVYVMRKSCV